MLLSIKLRDGFLNDTVSVLVDGIQVFHQSGVTTDLSISFAAKIEIPIINDIVNIGVIVENGIVGSTNINVKDTPFVEVWILNGQIKFRSSKEDIPML